SPRSPLWSGWAAIPLRCKRQILFEGRGRCAAHTVQDASPTAAAAAAAYSLTRSEQFCATEISYLYTAYSFPSITYDLTACCTALLEGYAGLMPLAPSFVPWRC
ncbi:unnamed protein product, partial [Sphacelaria rigidula]